VFYYSNYKDNGYYNIILATSPNLCLGAALGSPVTAKVSAFPSDMPRGSIWKVENVGWAPPGAFNFQYMGGNIGPLYARFGTSPIQIAPLEQVNEEFLLYTDDVGDGLVAINNHDRSFVMDANGDNPVVGAKVTPWKWNGGNNQRWRFVPTTLP
jgi:Ricin-type beta-trefoil lectin domain-like